MPALRIDPSFLGVTNCSGYSHYAE